MRLQKYILFNLKQLFSLNHFFVLFIYISFAWFLSQPPLDTLAIHNSERLISNYDKILLSIAFLNFLVFIMAHFNREMKKREAGASNKSFFYARFVLGNDLLLSYLFYCWLSISVLWNCLCSAISIINRYR